MINITILFIILVGICISDTIYDEITKFFQSDIDERR